MWMDSSIKMTDLDAFKHLPYFKPLYTTIIKLQMQYLVEQLSQNANEETLLLTTNPASGTVSKLASLHATGFLDQRSEIKAQFTRYCYESKGNARKRKLPFKSSSVSKKYMTKRFDNGNTFINPAASVHMENVMNSSGSLKPISDDNIINIQETNPVNDQNHSISAIKIANVQSLVQENTALDDKISDASKPNCVLQTKKSASETADEIDLTIVKKEHTSGTDPDEEIQSEQSCNQSNMEDVDSDLKNRADNEIPHHSHLQVMELTSARSDSVEDLIISSNVDSSDSQAIHDEKPYLAGESQSTEDWVVNQSGQDSDSMNDSFEKSNVFRPQYSSTNRESMDTSVNLGHTSYTGESSIPKKRSLADSSSHSQTDNSFLCTNAEGRFECDFCAQSFTTVSSKRRHQRKHTGENPFPCDLCGQKFYRKDDLNVHLFKHTGFKPYSCHICEAGYVKKKMLELHLATAHNILVSNLSQTDISGAVVLE